MDERKISRFEFPAGYSSAIDISRFAAHRFVSLETTVADNRCNSANSHSYLELNRTDEATPGKFYCDSAVVRNRIEGAMRRTEKLLKKFNFELVKEILFL